MSPHTQGREKNGGKIQRNMRICTSSEMRELDHIAEHEYGIEAMILMENAGRAAAQIVMEQHPLAGRDTEILIFAGKGNNAGDAFVVARRLISLDRRVRVFHFEDESGYKGPVLRNFRILQKMKAKMTYIESLADVEAFFAQAPGPFTIIDGILGTGLKGDLEGLFYDVVQAINALDCPQVIALDIPTGVSGDTGAIHGTSILASLTVSFGFPKIGHFLPPGASRRGELINVDICLPPRFRHEGDKFLLMKSALARLLKERDRYGHKNAFGHALLIGGSPGRLGAIAMSASACHKLGTGLVTVATWSENFDPLLMKLPNETMAVPLRAEGYEADEFRKNPLQYSSVMVGPGLGTRPEAKIVLQTLIQMYPGPLVIDADGLNLIAEHRMHDMLQHRRAPTVLTPHPGEMARLLGIPKEDVVADPVKAIRMAVEKTHATVLLKGAATLIASSTDEALYINHYPNDGMATAGSGDVLAGMIAGLLGQGMAAFEGTQLGVYLHSLAGDFAAKTFGHRSMTAPDIIESISHAIRDLKAQGEPTLPVEVRARLL